jgi:hypothetical protein
MESIYYHKYMQYLSEGKAHREIFEMLTIEGATPSEIESIQSFANKQENAGQRTQGFIMLTIGSVLLLVGFLLLLSLSFDHPAFEYVLYGFNTVGVCLCFYGLVKVLGW